MKRKLITVWAILGIFVLTLICFPLAGCSESIDPEVEWDMTFGGSDWDTGRSVRQTSDGGYIMVGQTGSYGEGPYDVWLVKVAAAKEE